MKEKAASNVTIISGTDGPTSIFTVGKKKQTLPEKIHKIIHKTRYQIRKLWVENHLTGKGHSIEDVCTYIRNHYGFKEICPHSKEYQEEYIQTRASFIMQYAPELLGEFARMPKLSRNDEAGIKNFMKQLELRQQAANNIPKDCFDIDLHMYKKKSGNMQMHFIVESKYGYISGGVSGEKGHTKQFERMYRDVYRYYGVTEDDINLKTRRYKDLIRILAQK